MIKEVEISNFQSHKYTLLPFGKGVNVITGRTHSGKSSIVRAIRWALQNRPQGDGFRLDGCKPKDPTSVAIQFDDNQHIVREKSKKKGINLYRSSESEDPYAALKTNVPEEIRSITRMRDENVQSQGDPYFLIDKTPGKVAEEINRVVGLKIIAEKLKKAKKIVLDANSHVTVLNSQIETAAESLKSPEMEGIDDLYAQAIEIEDADKALDFIDKNIEAIEAILSQLDDERNNVSESRSILNIKKKMDAFKIEYQAHVRRIEEQKKISDTIYLLHGYVDDSIIEISENAEETIEELSAFTDRRNTLFEIKGVYSAILKEKQSLQTCVRGLQKLESDRIEAEDKAGYCTKCGSSREYWDQERIDDEA